jgi:hypothetical protein|tara:strand:+ start:807 stop:980 length:174 start_codon:yes stop_codon:yes gene_type:complete
MVMQIIEVNINEVRGFRAGFELVEYENGTDPMDGFVLLGFDEVGQFCKEPKYAFIGE